MRRCRRLRSAVCALALERKLRLQLLHPRLRRCLRSLQLRRTQSPS
jgi:hypothetical protein